MRCLAAARAVYFAGHLRMYQPNTVDLTVNGSRQAALYERAAAETRARFGRKIFVRGVVEVSNHCRENCHYCGMRRDNGGLDRYRAHLDTLADLLLHHRPASVTDLNIQAGEDPVAVREVVLPLIRTLRRESSLGVSVCLGTLPPPLYQELQSAGASIYILKFETADPARYARLQAPGSLEERLAHVRWLVEHGWKVSSGFIAGLPGQGAAELAANLELARDLPIHGCSVSPFVVGDGTPLQGTPAPDGMWAINCMAALRLLRPEWIIPAVSALNLTAEDGYRRGLRAGANLVTINLTPSRLRDDYVIYKRDRIIMSEDRILSALEAEGLTPSTRGLVAHYEAGDHALAGRPLVSAAGG
ncbi:MAG: biotin synthase BioB [Limisphaerales bacterium]